MRETDDAEDPLAGLNPEQRAAAAAVSGPVCILAGPGTGKTRTVTHRIAQQVRAGAVPASAILAVTFTDRAAAELRGRLARLGVPAIRAATFHAAAWAQLRWFWPRAFGGPLPEVLASKIPLLARTARRARVEPQDLAAEIEWAKARRLGPARYAAAARDRAGPLPADEMAAVFAAYEDDKSARNAIDYEDMLLLTADLLARDADAAAEVRQRYRAFTVDEVQDCNPAQWALLEQWLGGSEELCVVGDPDQQIFTFTGASADYLLTFGRRFPHAQVVRLRTTYRCSPEVLAVAGSLRRGAKALVSDGPSGPPVRFRQHVDGRAEVASVVLAIQELLAAGTPASEIAVCYRINSQSALFEAAFAAARVPFRVRGDSAFVARPEVRQALDALRSGVAAGPPEDPIPAVGGAVAPPIDPVRWAERILRDTLRFRSDVEPQAARERERWRNIGVVMQFIREAVVGGDGAPPLDAALPPMDLAAALAQVEERVGGAADEVGAGGVSLLTLHKAKGTEFDAVFIVAVEEGLLPISHAKDPADVTEEARLLYVGVTRARTHLTLSWAAEREGFMGRVQRRRPSRFLYGLGPGAPERGATPVKAAKSAKPAAARLVPDGPVDDDVAAALKAWRLERARADGVPAYVVFPNSTLDALAAALPSGAIDLQRVPGLGPTRIERYGTDVLRVIADART